MAMRADRSLPLPLRGTACFEDRLFRFYDITLQGREYERMLADIANVDAEFIRTDVKRDTQIWELWHARSRQYVQVVYDPQSQCIITALEPKSYEYNRGFWVQTYIAGLSHGG